MLLSGKSLKHDFIRFVSATMASQVVFSLYSMVDGLMVSIGVNEYAMSAVNLAIPFTNALFSIAVLFAVGSSTLIAIFIAQDKRHEADTLFSQNFATLLIIGAVITALVLLFLDPFARLLGADEITLDYVKHYLLGIAPFSVCYLVSYNLEVLVKTDGYPRYALFTVIGGCLTNCVLDYIAIFHLDMGVFGAAVATGISQLATCISYFIHFFSKKCTFRLRKFRFDPRLYARILPIGLSDGVTELCTGLMIFLFNRTVLKCIGTDGVVTYTVIAYATTIIINLMVGVSQGTQPLVSYQYGKEDYPSCRQAPALRAHDRVCACAGAVRAHFPLRAADRARLPLACNAGADRILHSGFPEVQHLVSAAGLQHRHRRLYDSQRAPCARHLHFRRPRARAAKRGAADACRRVRRRGDLVHARSFRGDVPCHVAPVPAQLPQTDRYAGVSPAQCDKIRENKKALEAALPGPFGIPDQTLTGGLTLRSQLSHFMPCSTPSFTAGRLVPHRSLENKDLFDRRFDNPCNIDRQFK